MYMYMFSKKNTHKKLYVIYFFLFLYYKVDLSIHPSYIMHQ
jgi:hypothetical protein